MKTIYKYPVRITDEQTLMLPYGAEILTVGTDPQGAPCIWALVDPQQEKIQRKIYVVGTGNPMPTAKVKFIGTMFAANFVWHFFSGIS